MFLSDFDYELPQDLIAQHPPARRRDSRLLVVGESFGDRQFSDLAALLHAGDLLVFNDTRVIPARLHGRKQSGGHVEILVERVLSDKDVLAQVRASKTPKPGAILELAGDCEATVIGRERDMFRLRFSIPVLEFLEQHGDVPLPPYLGRDSEAADSERYQTVYAREAGAVAAPTAGLHFDEQMLEETTRSGVKHEYVTLHVGAGTFQPLREEQIEANRLHAERVQVSAEVCDAVRETRASGGRVIAVESLEGTDAMIERAGGLNGAGWTLLKSPAEDHDMRFDVPAIGPTTIERMACARGGCLALNAGRVIMIEKDKVLATAERLGIPIIGIASSQGPR